MRQVLQSVTILLQSATGITKCGGYYKVRQYTPSLQLTNLGNKFTVNSFLPYLRVTVKIFQFLRLSTKFLAVLRLSVNPIRTLHNVFVSRCFHTTVF